MSYNRSGSIIRYRKQIIRPLADEGKLFCHWCCKPLSYREASVDHIIPHSYRTNSINDCSNLVPACHPCNIERGRAHSYIKNLHQLERVGRKAATNLLKAEQSLINLLGNTFVPIDSLCQNLNSCLSVLET